MRTRTSLIRLSPPPGAEPRLRRQSQSSQAAQRLEALFSPNSNRARTKRHGPSRRVGLKSQNTGLFSIRAVVVKRFQANNSNFCRSRARASLRDQPLALPAWDQQEETEQSDSR